MKAGFLAAGSIAAGVAISYFLDPDSGRRRRALLRAHAVAHANSLGDFFDVSRRDLRNRVIGLVAEARYQVKGRRVGDERLTKRVRTKLGRYVSHPGAIEVTAEHGCVTLKGPILRSEAQSAVRAVSDVPGVKHVRNELEAHGDARGISSLQGGRPRLGGRRHVLQETWSPATRLFAGTTGALVALDGIRRGSLMGIGETAFGIGLLTRTSANRPITGGRR